MKLVLQHPYPRACELACLAMLCDTDLATIIRIAGTDHEPDQSQRQPVLEHFGLGFVAGYVTEGMGNHAIGALMRRHPTLLCSLSSYTDVNFAHAIVIHEGQCYDPSDGMNPVYPWHRYISRVRIYEKAEAKKSTDIVAGWQEKAERLRHLIRDCKCDGEKVTNEAGRQFCAMCCRYVDESEAGA